MQYRYVGASGLKVSPLTLGTMMFGDATDEATSQKIIASARALGVNSIDTADVYNGGESERVVGRALKQDRDWWVLATKLANPTGEGPNGVGISRKWINQAVEASLKRLDTPHLDILYLHKEVPGAPLGEAVRAIADLIRQGKIRYFGLSNFRGWRIAEVCRLADEMGIDRPVASQPLYNALTRQAENEQLPAAAHYGIGVFPYSPLARGVLTGKYLPNAEPPGDSRAARKDKRLMQTEFRAESIEIAQRIKAHAETRGMTAADFALAWVLGNPIVTSAIVGPRTQAHWDGYARVLDFNVTAEDDAFVDSLIAPGHPSTPGYNDPAYPIEGRPARK